MADNIEIIHRSLTADPHQRPAQQSRFVPAYLIDQEDGFDGVTYRYHHHENRNKSNEMDEQSQTTQTYVTHSSSEHSRSHHDSEEQHHTKTSLEQEKEIFHKARQYLKPGKVFRFFTYLFAERTLFTFFSVHCIATLVVWGT